MNKNTKRVNSALRKASKAGQASITFQVPVSNYHNSGALLAKTYPTTKGRDVVSQSRKRNMQERLLHNSGGGTSSCVTVHEPIQGDRPVIHLNHGYIHKDGGYRQPTRNQAVK